MAKIVKLTETQLREIITKVISEEQKADTSCLKGFQFNKASDYGYKKIDAYYSGMYNGMKAQLFTNGKCVLRKNDKSMMEQYGNWQCVNSKLTITNLSSPKQATPY